MIFSSKIQKLLKELPNNTVATTSWLVKQGISAQLRKRYEGSGWLKSIGYGAYSKLDDEPDVFGGIYALQYQLQLHVHVGALSALDIKDGAHFVPKNPDKRPVYLFSHSRYRQVQLPKWFITNFPMSIKYDRRLFDDLTGVEKHNMNDFSIRASSTERALFEMLSLVPKVVSFEHASLLFEGKEYLRAELVQKLLESCRIDVLKRLYLYFIEAHNLSVRKKLKMNKINLGRGLRVIAGGKCYSEKYDLMLPKLIQDEDVPI